MFKKMAFVLVLLTMVLAACAPGASQEGMVEKPTEAMEKATQGMEKATEVMMEKPTEEKAMQESTATPEAMKEDKPMEDKMMEAPAWFSVPMTNARTDESFTIHDFKGKVVLVETLAMWCPNCKKQQAQVKALHDALGDMKNDLVSIGLDIDPNEKTADLKAYTEANGFDWVYAVAPAEVSRELAALYGDTFLNPPSTPMLVIDRKGQVHPLPFGIKSAEDLKQALEPFLNEGM
jgi:thiol-disulfide isomerase/thioredoxin